MGSTTPLSEQMTEMAAQQRTITVYTAEQPDDLASHFADWNVKVTVSGLPSGSTDGFVTVYDGEQFLGSVDIQALEPLLEPELTVSSGVKSHGGAFEAFMNMLDTTLFRAFDRAQMLAATRELEDRAMRVGSGTVHAGFQRPGALSTQRSLYERLAKAGLDTHVYFDGDWNTDPIPGVTMHTDTGSELGQFWFVVFESNTNQDCALLGEEGEQRFYTGFWTYDTDRVTSIAEHLRAVY